MGFWDRIKSGIQKIGGFAGRVLDNYIRPVAGVVKGLNIPVASNIAAAVDKLGTSDELKKNVTGQLINSITGLMGS